MVRCTTKERSGMTDACSSVNVSTNTLADISVLRGELGGGGGGGRAGVGGGRGIERCTTKERSGMTDVCSSANVSTNTLADISVLRGELKGLGGGKVYHQGEKWDDGCLFQCECIDEHSGRYKCTER